MQERENSPEFKATAAQRAAVPDQAPTSYQPMNGQGQPPPPPPPAQTGRPRGGMGTAAILILAVVLLLVLGVGVFGGIEIGRNGSTSTGVTREVLGISAQPEQVAAKFTPSVVLISVVTNKGEGLGSGTIIDSRGYIVTNYHVVEGAKQIKVELYDGLLLPAQLTGVDPADDLAVVKIAPPSHMTVATIGDSSQLKVAEYVMAIGNPLGIRQTVTSGIVSALGKNIPEGPGAVIVDAIQTDAAINPGNSGGALVDLQGDLIGVPTLTIINPEFNAPASGVGYAIPSNRVKFIVPQLIESGKVTNTGRAAMGVSVVTVDQAVAAQQELSVDQGALIVSVIRGGPADSAGLKPGDVIVQLGNTPITSAASLGDALLSESPGATVEVKIYRGSEQMTVKVTMGELPAGAQVGQ